MLELDRADRGGRLVCWFLPSLGMLDLLLFSLGSFVRGVCLLLLGAGGGLLAFTGFNGGSPRIVSLPLGLRLAVVRSVPWRSAVGLLPRLVSGLSDLVLFRSVPVDFGRATCWSFAG